MQAIRTKTLVPSLPSSFFLSLTPEQRKYVIILLGKYRRHYADYFSFRWGMLKQSGFVYEMWANKLYHEVIEPTKLTKNMWRMLLIVWSMEQSKKYRAKDITRQTIKTIRMQCFPTIKNFDPFKTIRYCKKYGWLGSTKKVREKELYFISEKSKALISDYAVKYGTLFNQFFEPLEFR